MLWTQQRWIIISKRSQAEIKLTHSSYSHASCASGRYVQTDELTVVAEVVLASIEAFLGTVIDQDVCPHTERFQIELRSEATLTKPELNMRPLDMSATILWPAGLQVNGRQTQEVRSFFVEVSGHVLATTCMVKDIKVLLDKLFGDEAVGGRMAMVTAAVNSYHRVASRDLSRIEDWPTAVPNAFPAKPPRPKLTLLDIHAPSEADNDDVEFSDNQRPQIRSHRAVLVKSIIDVHAWDEAVWRGILYISFGRDGPPAMAFMFENEEAARKIFERWRARFGARDENEEIHIAIIEHLPEQPQSHYVVLVASRTPEKKEVGSGKAFSMATRSMTMNPDTKENLQRFLRSYGDFGGYYLLPAVMKDGQMVPITELALIKRALIVKEAGEVSENDIESVALNMRGLGGPQRLRD